MNNQLDNFNIEINAKELEEKIRQYYSSQDETISEIDVKYSTEYIQGQWNEAWQYHMGGHIKMNVSVKVTRKVKALGEDRIIKKDIDLDDRGIKDILSILLQKDNLEVETVHPDIFNKDIIRIRCKRLVNENKKDIKRSDNDFLKSSSYEKGTFQSKVAKIIRVFTQNVKY